MNTAAASNKNSTKLQGIINRYKNVRNSSEAICEPLSTEDYIVQPVAEVSPPKWHLAHTSWFFEEVILSNKIDNYTCFDTNYRLLFNSYYKSAGKHWLQAHRGQLSRPTVSDIYAYRSHVDIAMTQLLNDSFSIDLESLVEIGLHHEQQHQELLLMDIKYILATNPSYPVYCNQPLTCSGKPQKQLHYVDEGIYEIGHSTNNFCYDNETPRHKVYVHPHAIENCLVSNSEYLEFIEAGIYNDPTYWLSLGWDWVQENKIRNPLYWFQDDGKWYEFTLHGVKPLDPHAPVVHISYYEADAFARWRRKRLPTEQEMELFLTSTKYNRNEHRSQQILHPKQCDAIDNQVWCWTQSHYSPYPGYRPYEGMLGEYNSKFMCNQFVLRGGCIATPADHYRASYRNFYHPHQRWMFSGIRLAKDV